MEYVFGNATGAKHNIDRSIAMEKQLNSIGVFDNDTGIKLMHMKAILRRLKAVDRLSIHCFSIVQGMIISHTRFVAVTLK